MTVADLNTHHEELFIGMARAVLAQAARWAEAGGVRQGYKTRLVFTSDGSREDIVPVTDYLTMLREHFSELSVLPEVLGCAETFLNDDCMVHSPMTDDDGRPIESPTIAQRLPWAIGQLGVTAVNYILDRYQTLVPTDAQIAEVYQQLASTWATGIIQWEVVAPLVNFDSDIVGRMPLTARLALLPFSPEDKTQIWNAIPRHIPWPGLVIDFGAFFQARFALVASYSQPMWGGNEVNDAYSELEDLMIALRMLKVGDVGAAGSFGAALENAQLSQRQQERFIQTFTRTEVRHHGPVYTLRQDELTNLADLFTSLRALPPSKRTSLNVALQRFNQTYARHSPEDRILDVTIALEASLLYGIESELTYRLALRGAALVASTRAPLETKTLLNVLYDVRSKIVHEGRTVADLANDPKYDPRSKFERAFPGVPFHDLPTQAEDLTRDVLKSYIAALESGRTIHDVNKDLEDRLLDGMRGT